MPGGGVHAVRSWRVGELGVTRIAGAPPSALVSYQKRVAALADKLFREGVAGHDPRPLRRLVNDLFCSHVTGKALAFLGDLECERGNFTEACGWWRRLALPASEISARSSDSST